jgi:hypothetical protein
MLDNGRKARAAWNETVPANMCHYEEARRRLVEGERLVAGWGELIARMQADGHDVTVARSLLKTFEHELEDRMRKLARFGVMKLVLQRRQVSCRFRNLISCRLFIYKRLLLASDCVQTQPKLQGRRRHAAATRCAHRIDLHSCRSRYSCEPGQQMQQLDDRRSTKVLDEAEFSITVGPV